MPYCTKCGSEKVDQKCHVCDQEHMDLSARPQKTIPPNEQHVLHNNKRKKKRFAVSILLLIGISVGSYMAAENYFSPERSIDRLVEAIENEDVNTIRAFALEDSPEMTDETLLYFTKMMKKDDRLSLFRMDMLNQLNQESDAVLNDYPAVMEEAGNQFFFFQEYGLQFSDYELEIVHILPDDGVEVYYNEELVGMFEEGVDHFIIERQFPAESTITLKYSGSYGDATESVIVQEIGDLYSNRKMVYTWDFAGSYVQISSNRNDSYLMVNGEIMNQSLYETFEYGPVNFDEIETFQALAEGRFDEQCSEELILERGIESYELIFEEEDIDEVPVEELFGTINQHVTEWVRAYQDQNTGYFSMLTDEFAGSYLERTRNNFDKQREQGWRYQGKIKRIDYDTDSVEVLSIEDDRIEVSVDIRLNFMSSFYNSGTNPSDTPLTKTTSMWTYFLVFDRDRDSWLLNGQKELDDWNPNQDYQYEF